MGTVHCFECDRLWKKYEEVIFAQVRAQNQLGIVNFGYDSAIKTDLAAEVDRLTGRRSDLQAAIREHNREIHAKDITCRIVIMPEPSPSGMNGTPVAPSVDDEMDSGRHQQRYRRSA
jgi:hypothetical protein